MEDITLKELLEIALGHGIKAFVIAGVSNTDTAFTAIQGDSKEVSWSMVHLQHEMFKTLEKFNETAKRTTNKPKKGKA